MRATPDHSENPRRPRGSRAEFAAILAACLGLAGCASLNLPFFARAPSEALEAPDQVSEIYQRAGMDRTTQLELEVERLQADLLDAEEAMVTIESGLRGVHRRADAVSSLAESRVAVERAARNAPWSRERIQEAKQKLEEAERQFQAGHSGSAVFFASRARRIATALNEVARRVADTPGTRFVDRPRINMRSGPSTEAPVLHTLTESTPVFPEQQEGSWVLVRTPSGQAGWVHAPLLRTGWLPDSDATTQSLPASLAR